MKGEGNTLFDVELDQMMEEEDSSYGSFNGNPQVELARSDNGRQDERFFLWII